MTSKFIFAITKATIITSVVILYIHYYNHQSWGFFTIEPKQPIVEAYKIQNGIADKERVFSNNTNYGLGMCRKGIVLYTALRKLTDKNKDLEWKPLDEDSITSITKHGKYVNISTKALEGIYKGKFLITKTERPSDSTIINHQKFVALKKYILADVR